MVYVCSRVVGARKAGAAGQQRAGVGSVRQRPKVHLAVVLPAVRRTLPLPRRWACCRCCLRCLLFLRCDREAEGVPSSHQIDYVGRVEEVDSLHATHSQCSRVRPCHTKSPAAHSRVCSQSGRRQAWPGRIPEWQRQTAFCIKSLQRAARGVCPPLQCFLPTCATASSTSSGVPKEEAMRRAPPGNRAVTSLTIVARSSGDSPVPRAATTTPARPGCLAAACRGGVQEKGDAQPLAARAAAQLGAGAMRDGERQGQVPKGRPLSGAARPAAGSARRDSICSPCFAQQPAHPAHLGTSYALVHVLPPLHRRQHARSRQRWYRRCGVQAGGQPGCGAFCRLGTPIGARVVGDVVRQGHPQVGLQRRHCLHILLWGHRGGASVDGHCKGGGKGTSWLGV